MKGINWEVIHELLVAEMERVKANTAMTPESQQAILEELDRMNDIAVREAEKQS
jgi:hypothetical protein